MTSVNGNISLKYTWSQRQVICAWTIGDNGNIITLGKSSGNTILLNVKNSTTGDDIATKEFSIGYLYTEINI